MSEIDVNLVAWPNHPKRMEYFRHMWQTLHVNLYASEHNLRYHCSAESEQDPSTPWLGRELAGFCEEWNIPLTWRQGKADLGANMNAGLRLGTAPFVFLVQDDFELLHPCDLSRGATLLDAEPSVDLIRYGWPPMTQWKGDVHGWPRVDIDGQWPYGDEPALRRRTFMEKWGWFTEHHPRHGQSETDLMLKLVGGRATIVGADKMYFGNFGAVSAVPKEREYRDREIGR